METITIICDQTGDRAEALDAEAAIVAARTLCRDGYDASGGAGRGKFSASFFNEDGAPIWRRVPERELWIAMAP